VTIIFTINKFRKHLTLTCKQAVVSGHAMSSYKKVSLKLSRR